MGQREIRTFEEFWDFYVGEHRHPLNRALHFVGTTAAVSCVATGLLTKRRWLLAVGPALGYGPAWIGHFFVENNRPATLKYPLWSLQADFVMWWKIATRTMQAEVDRVVAAEAAAAKAAEEHDRNGAAEPNGEAPAGPPPSSSVVN
jgi:hypothetical protein